MALRGAELEQIKDRRRRGAGVTHNRTIIADCCRGRIAVIYLLN